VSSTSRGPGAAATEGRFGAGGEDGGDDLYTEHDRARLLPEPAKRSGLGGQTRREHRGPFARDRARVLHSAALRRLAGKTQVVGPGEGAEVTGTPRTRLTHSLEVAQIGRGIAEELGADPDIVDTAGLAHDIGHPPFGHNGEAALDVAAARCGGFEANAQTLRTLVRLEPKIVGGGLNLTRASLDASGKYPWPAGSDPGGIRPSVQRGKYGVYAEDLAVFRWLRDGAPAGRRCLEAQVMDWADDVAYSVHDVEDGILAGRIDLAAVADRTERRALSSLAADNFGADHAACEEAGARLAELPVVAEAHRLVAAGVGVAGQVALKRMTSELVSRFAAAAVDATRDAHGDGRLGRYRADLLVPAPVTAEVALLKAVAVRYVMADPTRLRAQARQRELLAELVEALAADAPGSLEVGLREDWLAAPDDAARWRVVIDQVAVLTDQQAVAWHARLIRES
jgi:dGTPase